MGLRQPASSYRPNNYLSFTGKSLYEIHDGHDLALAFLWAAQVEVNGLHNRCG